MLGTSLVDKLLLLVNLPHRHHQMVLMGIFRLSRRVVLEGWMKQMKEIDRFIWRKRRISPRSLYKVELCTMELVVRFLKLVCYCA